MVDGSEGAAVFLARIAGIVSSHWVGEGANGEYVGFKGKFFAKNSRNEMFEAAVAYFPTAVAKTLREQLEQGVVEIEVKVDVYAVETDKNASGYAYLCEPVLSESADKRSEELAKMTFAGKLPTQLALTNSSKKKTA